MNEAMASGCPAIVSETVGCAPDLIDEGKTGFTFPVGETGGLAQCLAKIAELMNKNFDFEASIRRESWRLTPSNMRPPRPFRRSTPSFPESRRKRTLPEHSSVVAMTISDLRWLLTPQEWKTGRTASLVIAGVTAVFTFGISPWIAVSVGVTVFTIYHMAHAARYIVPLPHIVILVSALQYVLAGWIGSYFPPLGTLQDTSAAFGFYLIYAGPVCHGHCLGLVRLSPDQAQRRNHAADYRRHVVGA